MFFSFEMTQPWEPDRKLTLDLATEVIRTSLPSLNADGLTFLGAGWEFDAFLTSDGWVVRFPRRDEMATLFEKERPVHQLVAEHLPAGVAVPRVEHLGKPSAEFPYPVAAHRYIAGIPVDELELSLLSTTARDIGHVLGAIHGIPEDAARNSGAVGAPTTYSADEGSRRWIENGLKSLSRLGDLDPVVSDAMDWVGGVSVP